MSFVTSLLLTPVAGRLWWTPGLPGAVRSLVSGWGGQLGQRLWASRLIWRLLSHHQTQRLDQQSHRQQLSPPPPPVMWSSTFSSMNYQDTNCSAPPSVDLPQGQRMMILKSKAIQPTTTKSQGTHFLCICLINNGSDGFPVYLFIINLDPDVWWQSSDYNYTVFIQPTSGRKTKAHFAKKVIYSVFNWFKSLDLSPFSFYHRYKIRFFNFNFIYVNPCSWNISPIPR